MSLAKDFSEKEFAYKKSDFESARKIIYDYAGISLSDHKQHLVYSRLAPRLRKNNLNEFSSYFNLIEKDPVEFNAFVNALTTNKTAFFREIHHFEYLKDTIIPESLEKHNECNIWSAGCSTGEEPYNIAMMLEPFSRRHSVSVLATDLDTNVLNKARTGVYDLPDTSEIPKEYLKKYFLKGKNDNSGRVKVVNELEKFITFQQLNLMHDWPIKKQFYVIFCRNVIIYFDKQTQKKLFERFSRQLLPSGYLILGHSESMGNNNPHFNFVGKTIYRKIS